MRRILPLDRARGTALAAALFASCAQNSWRGLELELVAGEHARRDSIVRWDLPREVRGWDGYRLVSVVAGTEVDVPVQVMGDGERLTWIARGELAAGEARTYFLRRGRVDSGGVEVTRSASGVALHAGERELLVYRDTPVAPPAGVEAKYARSGYLHPVRTPAGRAVTGDFPASHRHQHGVFLAWTRTLFEGRSIDFWNAGADLARVECAELAGSGGGAVAGWLHAAHDHVDLTAPGGPRTALTERWEVEAFPLEAATVLDLRSTLACASALEVESYPYGGLAVRGPEAWEGEVARVTTSDGHDRAGADGARVDWCALYGPRAGFAVMGAPDNLRAPQPVRVHPTNPYFCFAPCRLGAFAITRDEPLTQRYRIVAFDGEPDRALLDRLWLDLAEPPRVRVVPAQSLARSLAQPLE